MNCLQFSLSWYRQTKLLRKFSSTFPNPIKNVTNINQKQQVTYRTLAKVCLRFRRYLLWYRCRSPIDPCSACILPETAAMLAAPEDEQSLEVVLVTDFVRCCCCPFLPPALALSVGEGLCTFQRFWNVILTPPRGCNVVGSSKLVSSSESSSAISWRCGEGWRARGGGLSSSVIVSAGGEGGAALPSAGAHQGKQHFQIPTSVTSFSSSIFRGNMTTSSSFGTK